MSSHSIHHRIALVTLTAFTLTGATGCRRVRRWWEQHRHHRGTVTTARTNGHARPTPVVANADAGPPASCEGATETGPANHTLHTSGPVEALAVASSSGHTLILASVGGAMHSVMLGAPTLNHLAAGVPGDRETEPSVVPTRDGFAATWRRSHGGNEYLVFVRLDSNGTLIGEEHAEQLDAGRPGASIASADRSYALGYVTAGAVAVQLVNEEGAFDGPPTLLPGSAGAHGIDLAWMPPNYLATWVTETRERSSVTVGMMPGASHEVHPLSALQVATGRTRVRIAPAGDHFVMSLYNPSADGSGPNVFTTGFESTGVRLSDPQPLGEHGAEIPPALAYDGHATAVTWRETTGDNATVDRWVKVNERGERQGDPWTVGGSAQTGGAPATPVIAWDGTAYVLVRGGADPETVAIHRFGPNGCDAR